MEICDISTSVNIVLSILSFVLALISVVTVVITLKQNKKFLESNEHQLKEMREEHQLSVQPILVLENESFYINRPKLYYTPPQDSYDFISIYRYEATLKNVSSATAICIDITAELIVQKDGGELRLGTITERYNILPANEESETITILFHGDSQSYLYEALREQAANQLPKIKIKITYRNTCGGYFLYEKNSILVPNEKDSDVIRTWHTSIIGAPTEAKEAIDAMKKASQNKEWERVFNASQKVFDMQLRYQEKKDLLIGFREIPEKYRFCNLTKEEYEEMASKYAYPHFVHKMADCKRSGSDTQ